MASDAARRFLLSVPAEPQLLLRAGVVSLRPERRHLLLLPLVSLGSGRGGKREDGAAIRRWACSLAATRDPWAP